MFWRSPKVYFSVICLFGVILIVGFIVLSRNFYLPGFFIGDRHGDLVNEVPPADKKPGPISSKPSTLLFVGDMMFDRSIRTVIEREQNPLYPFLLLASTTRAADLLIGNLEGPISARGTNQGSEYSFEFSPTSTINALKHAGFDVLNLANNHIFDYGLTAASDTMQYLREAGISYIGFGKDWSETNEPVIKILGTTRIAFLGFTEFYGESARAKSDTPGLSMSVKYHSYCDRSNYDMCALIAQAKKIYAADIVVVSMHWGQEYETHSNNAQRQLAHQLIDAGADLIVGHHPHVAQEVEYYSPFPKGSTPAGGRDLESKSLTASGPLPLGKGEGYIAYSLGNFVFDQNFSADTGRGLMLRVTLAGSKIRAVEPLEVKFTSEYQPYLSAGQ